MSRPSPEMLARLDMEKRFPPDTYLDHLDEVFIGPKYDLGRRGTMWDLYRKGNYVTYAHTPDVLLRLAIDQEGGEG